VASGDLLVIDWGAIVDDYPSDITRTYGVGRVEPELQRIHSAVEEANGQARRAARPGVSGRDIDRAARDVIEEAGYGEFFTHRTGHGLGLEIHEPPYIMARNSEPLTAGNVFTIEPGIYLPDRAGVRIEDNVVLTEDDCLSLTTLPRNLVMVGH
jgi:Xaa-Pro dipeptidase